MGRERFPCLFTELIPLVTIGLFGFPLVIRALHFYWRIQLNRKLASSAFAKDAEASNQVKQAAQFTDAGVYKQTMLDLYTARILASKGWAWSLQVTFTIAFVAAAIGLSIDRLDCQGCESNPNSFLAQAAFTTVLLVIAVVGLYIVRKERDPLGIKDEMKLCYTFSFTGLVLNVIFDSTDPGDTEERGEFFWNYLLVFALWMSQAVLMPYQIYISKNIESQRKVRRTSELDLVLDSDIGKEYFKTHLVNELCIENYFFWRDVNAWKEAGRSAEGAKQLYDIYIERNSVLEINIGHNLYVEITKALQQDKMPDDIFDSAYAEIMLLMETNSLPRFKKSSLYKEWAGEDSNLHLETAMESI